MRAVYAHTPYGTLTRMVLPKGVPLREGQVEGRPMMSTCQECHMTMGDDHLLLCDYPTGGPMDGATCDRMVCLGCAGYSDVPDGNFFCRYHKK